MNKVEKVKALLVIVTGLVIMYFIFEVRWMLYVAACVGVLSLLIPFIGDLIVKGWFKLAEVLGWVNSRILLSLVFFILLYPLALLARLFGKSDLKLRKPPEGQSMFEERNHRYTREDLENLW